MPTKSGFLDRLPGTTTGPRIHGSIPAVHLRSRLFPPPCLTPRVGSEHMPSRVLSDLVTAVAIDYMYRETEVRSSALTGPPYSPAAVSFLFGDCRYRQPPRLQQFGQTIARRFVLCCFSWRPGDVWSLTELLSSFVSRNMYEFGRQHHILLSKGETLVSASVLS